METNTFDITKAGDGFELFKIGNSKQVVDLSPNTLRAYNKQGLPLYKLGKILFCSKIELAEFIKRRGKIEA